MKRTLDAEDRFERIEKGETSATNPRAESGSITGKDRGPLHLLAAVGDGWSSWRRLVRGQAFLAAAGKVAGVRTRLELQK